MTSASMPTGTTMNAIAGSFPLRTLIGHVQALTDFRGAENPADLHAVWRKKYGGTSTKDIVAAHTPANTYDDTPAEESGEVHAWRNDLINAIRPALSHALIARSHELTRGDVLENLPTFASLASSKDLRVISEEAATVLMEGAFLMVDSLRATHKQSSINLRTLGRTIDGIMIDVRNFKEQVPGQPWQFAGQFLTRRGYIASGEALQGITSAAELFETYPIIRSELNLRLAAVLLNSTDGKFLSHTFGIDELVVNEGQSARLIDPQIARGLAAQVERGDFLRSGIHNSFHQTLMYSVLATLSGSASAAILTAMIKSGGVAISPLVVGIVTGLTATALGSLGMVFRTASTAEGKANRRV